MRDTRQFSVDMAETVERKISSGAYASVSDMIQEGVRALLERDDAVERWLSDDVVKSYDQYKADPAAAIPADQVLERIQARVASRRAAESKA